MNMKTSLKNRCEAYFQSGLNLDLSDCHYGETESSGVTIRRPAKYYYFLSEFVRREKIKKILEIGTNCGGSIMAMRKGIKEEDLSVSKLVTVDIEEKDIDGFKKYPDIIRVLGDSLDPGVVKQVIERCENDVSLLYIDSLHEYEHTLDNIKIYSEALNPEYIILDDIRQNDQMCRLWEDLKIQFGENAVDISDVIKRHGAGFGIIRWRE